MGKRTPPPGQLGFSFEPREAADLAAFAGADARVSAEVGRILKADPRSREEIAGAVTAAVADDVSRFMLDAYASPARDTHNISFGRALALIAVTGDQALIEWAVGQLGGAVLWGEEITLARIGQLEARRRQIDAELRPLKANTRPITREGRR